MGSDALLRDAFQKCRIDERTFPHFKECADTLRKNLEIVRQLPHAPAAVEAFWDGDTGGWYVVLVAIEVTIVPRFAIIPWFGRSQRKEYDLMALRFGGDIRIFNNAVPPWPEAEVATALGNHLSQEWRIPFYFPSPTEPDNDCPRWGERAVGSCKSCRKPVMRLQDTGVCYPCWVKLKYSQGNEPKVLL